MASLFDKLDTAFQKSITCKFPSYKIKSSDIDAWIEQVENHCMKLAKRSNQELSILFFNLGSLLLLSDLVDKEGKEKPLCPRGYYVWLKTCIDALDPNKRGFQLAKLKDIVSILLNIFVQSWNDKNPDVYVQKKAYTTTLSLEFSWKERKRQKINE